MYLVMLQDLSILSYPSHEAILREILTRIAMCARGQLAQGTIQV